MVLTPLSHAIGNVREHEGQHSFSVTFKKKTELITLKFYHQQAF